ncbi:MAG: hypothetical protein R2712_17585 [Vicinamibacterales bacterium]
MQGYRDTAINVGGPIKKDRIWWNGAFRQQKNQVAQPNFRFDGTFDTQLTNPSTKWTYQVNQANKLIGYYQAGKKLQPNRLPFSTYFYDDAGETWKQQNLAWVWKGEWNGTISDKLYVEARMGDFGYYFPLLSNGDATYGWRDTALGEIEGSYYTWQIDRDRKQTNGAATYFLDTGTGSHTFKFGGELLRETAWEGYLAQSGKDPTAPFAMMDHQYANGVSTNVVFRIPTAINHLGSLKDNDDGNILPQAKVTQLGFFVTDTWALGRLTVNAGLRYDRYRSFTPEQEQLAWTTGPVSVAARTFAETTYATWNSVAPRVGVTFDLSGDGRTVLKANYGLYYHNPGVAMASDANQNQPNKTVTYAWTDRNGDRRWQAGEEGALPTNTNLAGTITVDPDIKQPYSHDVGAFVERQIGGSIGTRIGFVMKTEDNLYASYQAQRPIGAYSVPFPFVDIGVDGVRGTADDRTLTLYGLPSSEAASFPVNTTVMTTDRYSRYRTIEASVNRRHIGRWSVAAGASYTMLKDFPGQAGNGAAGFPNNPNAPGVQERSTWDFKLTGQYDAPWGFKVTPALRHQSGPNYARTIAVPQSAATPYGLIYTGTIYAGEDGGEPGTSSNLWSFRQDNITILDVRIERSVSFGSTVRLRPFLDLFNILNNDAYETINVGTGSSFQRPSAILAPRTMRIGFRFVW